MVFAIFLNIGIDRDWSDGIRRQCPNQDLVISYTIRVDENGYSKFSEYIETPILLAV